MTDQGLILPIVLAMAWAGGCLIAGSDRMPWPEGPPPGGHEWLIDLATAPEAELRLLPGIGPARSGAIMALRSTSSPVLVPSDLRRIPGIGDVLCRQLESSGMVLDRTGGEPDR